MSAELTVAGVLVVLLSIGMMIFIYLQFCYENRYGDTGGVGVGSSGNACLKGDENNGNDGDGGVLVF